MGVRIDRKLLSPFQIAMAPEGGRLGKPAEQRKTEPCAKELRRLHADCQTSLTASRQGYVTRPTFFFSCIFSLLHFLGRFLSGEVFLSLVC